MPDPSLIAAVDLGSNSFHLVVARVLQGQIVVVDRLRETTRLAAGLDHNRRLDAALMHRALGTLTQFGQRIREVPRDSLRVVGTATLRRARNADEFMTAASDALGAPIEVLSGREEARLIYLGVAHSLEVPDGRRLVVDIGGGSTEVILGERFEPLEMESASIGCVTWTAEYFADGELKAGNFRAAETAAELELQHMARRYRTLGWDEAVGSSGTARALGEMCRSNGYSDGAITLDGLHWLREHLVKLGSVDLLDIPGLKADRRPVIAGGLAIMLAIFEELGVERMNVALGAMREGILWDMLGRVHDRDMRDVTVSQFQRRYQVDMAQALRVETLALGLFQPEQPEARQRLAWAARLHEIGISIAHSGFHKHGAYILENADMPGFSRRDQAFIALLVRAGHGSLGKLALAPDADAWPLILCLRLGQLFNMSRSDSAPPPPLTLRCAAGVCQLSVPCDWLKDNPLTRAALEEEVREWATAGLRLELA